MIYIKNIIKKILKRIKQFNGLKVIFRQDEHKNVRKIEEFVLDLRFDIFHVFQKISNLKSKIPQFLRFLYSSCLLSNH